jgi:hypothetical protein
LIAALTEQHRVKALVLDIETGPNLVWTFNLRDTYIGIDQIVEPARMICFAAKWLDRKNAMFHAEWIDGREAMIETAWRLLDECDYLIGFNQISFDTKWMMTEFTRMGLGPPSPFKEVDLKRVAFQRFRFPSSKLDWLSQELGLGRKMEHEGFPLWVKVLNGDPKAQRRMRQYNIQDVKLTEDLYFAWLAWIKNHPPIGVLNHTDMGCRNCGSTDITATGKDVVAQVLVYRLYQCNTCGAWMRGNIRVNKQTPAMRSVA